MTIGYKLTDANDCTKGGMQWGEGVTHTVAWSGLLCKSGVLHFYDDPFVAVLMDRHHGRYLPAGHLWECEWIGKTVEDGTKRGAETVTAIRRMDVPMMTLEQRAEIAIRCAIAVLPWDRPWTVAWCQWAEKWLSGEDRNRNAAAYAAADAYAAYAADAAAYAYAAAYAAYAAADAYAADAAADAYAAYAYAAAYAAYAAADAYAAYAADAAAYAYAARRGTSFSLVAICRWVCLKEFRP